MDVGHEGDVFVDEGEGGNVFGHLDLSGGEIVVGPGEDGFVGFEGEVLIWHIYRAMYKSDIEVNNAHRF